MRLSEQHNDKHLINAMHHYDHTVNIRSVMAHYHATGKCLDSGAESVEVAWGRDLKKVQHWRGLLTFEGLTFAL